MADLIGNMTENTPVKTTADVTVVLSAGGVSYQVFQDKVSIFPDDQIGPIDISLAEFQRLKAAGYLK